MLKKKLLWQIFPCFILIIILSLASVIIHLSYSLNKFYYDKAEGDLKTKTELILNQIGPLLANGQLDGIDELAKGIDKQIDTRVTVILRGGSVVGESRKEIIEDMEIHSGDEKVNQRTEIRDAFSSGAGFDTRYSNTLNKKMMYYAIAVESQVPDASDDEKYVGIIRTSIAVDEIDKEIQALYGKVLFTIFAAALFSGVISLFLSRRISKPMEQMKKAAEDFAAGNYDSRAPVPDSSELAELANTFNKMAEQLNERIEMITAQRNQSAAILTSMAEGVIAVDMNSEIVSINDAAKKFFDIERADVEGVSIQEVIRNAELQDFVVNTLANPNPSEVYIINNEQEKKHLRVHGTRLTDTEGKTNGAVIVLNDVTRLRKLENIRRDFVANVSHELKTPITSIKGFVETLLEENITDAEESQKFLKIIAKHADRLNAIVDDLLSLSRLEENDNIRKVSFEQKSLCGVLDAAVELSGTKAKYKEITIELDCDGQIEAMMNPALLEQAVVNLIDNAVKYSEAKSVIKVKGQKVNSNIEISVEDNGCGIGANHLERIFERFYMVDKSRSRKLGGTGLGLAIVKHIAQIHKGTVTVSSTVGKGSVFTIIIAS